jgi:hypothetical protein
MAKKEALIVGGVLLIIAIIFGILAAVGVFSSDTPADTPNGGVTTKNHEKQIVVISDKPTNLDVAAVNVDTPANMKMIRVSKDSTGKVMPVGENSDWRTFQIGEIKAYGVNGLLTAADYESATYTRGDGGRSTNSPAYHAIDGNERTFTHTTDTQQQMHELTLILKKPQPIVRIEVINRMDCCQSRLAGAIMEMFDDKNNLRLRTELNGTIVQVMYFDFKA